MIWRSYRPKYISENQATFWQVLFIFFSIITKEISAALFNTIQMRSLMTNLYRYTYWPDGDSVLGADSFVDMRLARNPMDYEGESSVADSFPCSLFQDEKNYEIQFFLSYVAISSQREFV